jgi:hypothetical protein
MAVSTRFAAGGRRFESAHLHRLDKSCLYGLVDGTFPCPIARSTGIRCLMPRIFSLRWGQSTVSRRASQPSLDGRTSSSRRRQPAPTELPASYSFVPGVPASEWVQAHELPPTPSTTPTRSRCPRRRSVSVQLSGSSRSCRRTRKPLVSSPPPRPSKAAREEDD